MGNVFQLFLPLSYRRAADPGRNPMHIPGINQAQKWSRQSNRIGNKNCDKPQGYHTNGLAGDKGPAKCCHLRFRAA